MTREDLITVVNKVVMEEIEEVDLCLICCYKVINEDNHLNNNSQLSSNLIVFYLLRRVLQVTGIELKKNLMSCGNPVEWIRLCDKCNELTRQAEELNRKLKKIERELNCVQQLIWDKARSSINNEADRKLVEVTIDLTQKTSKVWRRLRNHIANKCNLSNVNAPEPVINPFSEGDKLANCLITQKSSTAAILPPYYSEQNEEDDDNLNLLEKTTVLEATSSSSLFPLKILREVKAEIDLEAPPSHHHQNYKNLLRGDSLGEHDDEEEMEVDNTHGASQLTDPLDTEQLNNYREGEEEDGDWNWEPDDDDEEKIPEKVASSYSGATKRKKGNQPLIHQTTSKGSQPNVIETENGKFKCRHCGKIYLSLGGCRQHEREKHPETPATFFCDICAKTLNSLSQYRTHKLCSHRMKLDGTPVPRKDRNLLAKEHICEQCAKGFKDLTDLKKHVRFVHEKRFDIQCALCGKGWTNKGGLKKHMLVKHPEDPSTKKLVEEEGVGLWKCPVVACNVTFLKEGSLKGHLKSQHGKSEKEVEGLELARGANAGTVLEDPDFRSTCHICGKGFGSKSALNQHEKVHEKEGKEKEFFCDICGRGFVDGKGLKVHVDRIHLKKVKPRIKKFECQVCGMGFTHSCYFKDHVAIHEREGKRDHVCDKCGHGFITEKYLKKHAMTTSCGGGRKKRRTNKKGE